MNTQSFSTDSYVLVLAEGKVFLGRPVDGAWVPVGPNDDFAGLEPCYETSTVTIPTPAGLQTARIIGAPFGFDSITSLGIPAGAIVVRVADLELEERRQLRDLVAQRSEQVRQVKAAKAGLLIPTAGATPAIPAKFGNGPRGI